MNKLLADQKYVAFIGAFLMALAGWGSAFTSWSDILQVDHLFGLLGIVGALLLSNAAKSLFVEGGSDGTTKFNL